MYDPEGQPFRPTPFFDPREEKHLGKAKSPSKFRSSQKHKARRNAVVKTALGKPYADMSPEEKLEARRRLRVAVKLQVPLALTASCDDLQAF
jgi:hypothetical protein